MFKQRQTDMLNGVIWKEILLFFIPIMFGSIFQQLYNTADAMVVGNYVGKEALAAVGGSTGVVIGLLVNLIVGLSSGATVVIAQAYGSNDYSSVKKAVQTAMSSSVYIGAIFTVIGIIFTPWAMNMLNVPTDIMDYSVLYMRIYMLGMIPTMIYNTGAGILRAVGDSKRPLYFLVAACITNIVLDILFVVFFHWDVAGVAIATVVSQVVSGVLTLYILSAEDSAYYFDIRNLHCDMHILKQILVIGLPNGIQGALYSFANLFIQATVNGYGTNTVAAYTAFGKIDALFWNYSGALGTATLTFIGQNFGAGKIKRMKQGVWNAIGIYTVGSLLITIMLYFHGDYICGLFTQDAEVIDICVQMIRQLCVFWPVFVFLEIYVAATRACGDVIYPMIITMLGIGVLRIVYILFVPSSTVFESLRIFPITWVVTSSVFVIYYFQGSWLKRSIQRRNITVID